MTAQDAPSLRAQRDEAMQQGKYEEALQLAAALVESFPAEADAEDWLLRGCATTTSISI